MDPLTASLLFQGAGSLIQGLGTSSAAKKNAEFQQELSRQGKAEIPGLEKKVGQYRIGESMRELARMSAEDPIGDLARQNLQRSQASSVNALKSGGAKSLFALPATMQAFTDKERKIDADSFGRRKSALTTVGQAEENVNRLKFNQDVNDLNSARSQALGFEMGAFNQEQAGRDARLGLLTSGLSTLGSLAAAGSFGDGSGNNIGRNDVATGGNQGYDLFRNYSGLNQNNSPFSEGYDFGYKIPPFGSAPNFAAGIYRGRSGEYAQGGRTKGAFSHDANDMKIVDKNGKSTGMSVTGDEVVLNPLQQKKVLEQSPYFRSLMKTPRFK